MRVSSWRVGGKGNDENDLEFFPSSSSPSKNPKMDAINCYHKQIGYPDIKGHKVMTFVRPSAHQLLSTLERKINNAPKQSMVSIR
jgi:hypothetical protein